MSETQKPRGGAGRISSPADSSDHSRSENPEAKGPLKHNNSFTREATGQRDAITNRQEAVQTLAEEADIPVDALNTVVSHLENIPAGATNLPGEMGIAPGGKISDHQNGEETEKSSPEWKSNSEPTPTVPSKSEVRKFTSSVAFGTVALLISIIYATTEGVLSPITASIVGMVLVLICLSSASLYINFDTNG